MELQHPLIANIKSIISEARAQVYRQTNTVLLQMYWDIGRLIVEDEQHGEKRAEYGKAVLKNLAEQLALEFGKGFDERNLNNMRAFYRAFPIWNAVRTELSWTHYRILARVEDEALRQTYMRECAQSGWNTRTLQRNIDSNYLGRLLKVPESTLSAPNPKEFIKDPYIFEFLGIPHQGFSESDLESALIQHLQQFLMELGKGYAFVARQRCNAHQQQHRRTACAASRCAVLRWFLSIFQMKHFFPFLVKDMKPAEKIRRLLACLLLVMAITSCTSQRPLTKEERTVPPQMLETVYNLVRAKLVKLQLVEKVVVEIDTVGCSRRYFMHYDSWFMEMLDIGHRLERNDIRYKLSVRGKPYFHDLGYITLEEPGKIFYTRYDENFLYGDMKQALCKETVPDTALEGVRLSAFVLDACEEDYLPMTAEEAILIARCTFQLDSSIPCVHAWAHKGRYELTNYSSICTTSDAGFWVINFKVEPTDTTVYYNLKMDTELGEEEIRRILKKRSKSYEPCECPEITLICSVDAETRNICSVNIHYGLSSDESADIPKRLYPFARRIWSIRDSLATEYWR